MPLLRCQQILFVTLVKTDKKIKNKAFTEIVEITLKNNKMKQLSCATLQYNKKMNGEFIYSYSAILTEITFIVRSKQNGMNKNPSKKFA